MQPATTSRHPDAPAPLDAPNPLLDMLEELLRCPTVEGPNGALALCIGPERLDRARRALLAARPVVFTMRDGKRYRGSICIDEE